MPRREIRAALERLAHHGARWLVEKSPHWGDAILCDGLLAAGDLLHDKSLAEAAAAWFEPKLAAGPRLEGWFWFWSAEALPALGLYAKTKRKEFLDYAKDIVDAFETKAKRTPAGAIVPHPPALEVWVDVAYFTAPAMARLGHLVRERVEIQRALDQVLAHQHALIDPKTGLFWHVAYLDKKGHSPCLWARGNSWYSIAATQVLCEGVSESDPKVKEIKTALASQLNAVCELQDGSGLWHTVMNRADTYLEASAAAGFALGLTRALGMKLKDLDRERAERSRDRALKAVCEKIDEHGELRGVSQQTPPGDAAHYNSIELGTASYASGVAMMALAETLPAA